MNTRARYAALLTKVERDLAATHARLDEWKWYYHGDVENIAYSTDRLLAFLESASAECEVIRRLLTPAPAA